MTSCLNRFGRGLGALVTASCVFWFQIADGAGKQGGAPVRARTPSAPSKGGGTQGSTAQTPPASTQDVTVLWSPGNRQPLANPSGPTPLEVGSSSLRGWAFSPDGSLVLAAEGNSIVLWSSSSGRRLHSFGDNRYVRSVGFTRDGDKIIALLWDREFQKALIIRLYSVTSYELLSERNLGLRSSEVIFKSGRGDGLSTYDDHLQVFVDLLSGSPGLSFPEFADRLIGRSGLVEGHKDGKCLVFDVDNGNIIASLDGSYEVMAVTSDRSKFVQIADRTDKRDFKYETVELRSLKDGSLIRKFEEMWVGYVEFAISSGAKALAQCGKYSGSIRVWSIETGELLREFKIPWKSTVVRRPVFLGDGSKLLVIMNDAVRVWSIRTGRLLNEFPGNFGPFDFDGRVDISLDGKRFVLRRDKGAEFVAYDDSGMPIHRMPYCSEIAFSADSERFICDGYNRADIWGTNDFSALGQPPLQLAAFLTVTALENESSRRLASLPPALASRRDQLLAAKPNSPQLQKGLYETNREFEARRMRVQNDYLTAERAHQRQVAQVLEEVNAFVRLPTSERKDSIVATLSSVLGEPFLEDVLYDADTETFTARVSSLSPLAKNFKVDFVLEGRFPPDRARELHQRLKEGAPRLAFHWDHETYRFVGGELTAEGVTYSGSPACSTGQQARIVLKESPLRALPSEDAPVGKTLPRGNKITVITGGEWASVCQQGAVAGFVSSESLGEVGSSISKSEGEKKDKRTTQSRSPLEGLSCYEIGVRFGRCATMSMKGLSCRPGDDVIVPPRCRNNENTNNGIRDGAISVW